MGNQISDDESNEIIRKAIIPFRVKNNGFQVDYKTFQFRSFAKPKVDKATSTKYDDTFLELNTRSKIVGDIRKVFTISAENISEEYTNLRRNYYSRIFFGVLTFIIGTLLTNIGLVQLTVPKGRILIIFGGLMLILCFVTVVIVIYTDRRLKHLNKEFTQNCVKIMEKEKIVTWTASFQHLLFDIVYPYNGKSGIGAVILSPNPWFDIVTKTDDKQQDLDINVRTFKNSKLPIPQWPVIDESVSLPSIDGPNEEAPLIKNDKYAKFRRRNERNSHLLIYPPSDEMNSNDDEKDEEKQESIDKQYVNDNIDDDDMKQLNDIIPQMINNDRSDDGVDADGDDDDEDDDDVNNNDNQEAQLMIKQFKQPPTPYTGFDDLSRDNVIKIHGQCVQNYFLDNAEEIEGHGEDTGLLDNMPNPNLNPNKNNQIVK